MKSNTFAIGFLILALAAAAILPAIARGNRDGRPTGQASVSPASPEFAITCLITKDVKGLTTFYEKVLQSEPHKTGDDYVEFRTPGATLALFSSSAQEAYIPGVTIPGENHSAILQFRVSDVDKEYARLQSLVKTWIKPPTTQPWGTRSIYFRDPDGNLVDFFSPAAAR